MSPPTHYFKEAIMKSWYKSKTVWLGILIVAGGIAEYIAGLPAGASIPTIIAGIIAVIVRFLTKDSLTT